MVALAIVEEARSGALGFNLGITLARVAALHHRHGDRRRDRLRDGARPHRRSARRPLVAVLLNLPALVIIVLAYIWIGLNEIAAIGAVALNKIPNAIVTLREGARSLDPQLDEMADVFRLPYATRLRHVLAPQLAPYFAAAARSGLSLVWKIVLIVELLGRSNGIGFEINIAFQLFDMTLLLAYALPFVVIMLTIETFVVQPFERHVSSWRLRTA